MLCVSRSLISLIIPWYVRMSVKCEKIQTHAVNINWEINKKTQVSLTLQGLFVPFARVGSGDPVRILHLFHNEYTR